MDRIAVIDRIKALAAKTLPVNSSLLLYGSRARGDYRADSDWDLLILLGNNYQSADVFGMYAYPFVQLGWEYGTYFSPKVYTYDEWAMRKGSPFFENINREGVVLC